MSTFDPKSDMPKGSTEGKPGPMACSEWEALLVDALDGTLSAAEAAAFETHRADCLACAQLLEEAKRGAEWLNFLDAEPEVPQDLVSRILAQTSGTELTMAAPLAAAGEVAVVVPPGWLPGLERHAARSRWMMTAAMAFFSIAFTLNLTGVRLNDFHLSDLKPTAIASTLTRQFYVADAHLVRYYDNLRFVYELESRVREIKQNTTSPSDNPQKAPVKVEPQAQPGQKKSNGGSAQKGMPGIVPPAIEATPVKPQSSTAAGEPVMASLRRNAFRGKLANGVSACRGTASSLARNKFFVVEARTGKQVSDPGILLCSKRVKSDLASGREGV